MVNIFSEIEEKVFFYDELNLSKEFANYQIEEIKKIDEPIKYADGFDTIKCLMIVCRKSINNL